MDTSVLVSAFRNRNGSSYHLLRLLEDGVFVALASTPLLIEYEAVLKRPEQLRSSGLTVQDIKVALRALGGLLEPVEIWYKWRPQLPDADDDMVLETVVNGRADILVTYNSADFREAARRFGFRMLTPGAYLKELLT